MTSKYHESDKRKDRAYAFESLSRYFDVIHWPFCAAPLKVRTRLISLWFWDFSFCSFRDLIYAQSACNTPKRKENLKSHHMTPLMINKKHLMHIHFPQFTCYWQLWQKVNFGPWQKNILKKSCFSFNFFTKKFCSRCFVKNLYDQMLGFYVSPLWKITLFLLL